MIPAYMSQRRDSIMSIPCNFVWNKVVRIVSPVYLHMAQKHWRVIVFLVFFATTILSDSFNSLHTNLDHSPCQIGKECICNINLILNPLYSLLKSGRDISWIKKNKLFILVTPLIEHSESYHPCSIFKSKAGHTSLARAIRLCKRET